VSRPTDDETFLRRWSRRKHEEENKPLAPQPAPPAGESEKEREASAPPLPPLEKLTPQSDFSAFMHPKVQDSLRRVALKKLFADPHFNVMDLNEAYSGDWTGGEPITQEMLAQLNQARTLLFSDEEKKKLEEQAAQEVASEQETKETKEAKEDKPDEPRRQDA
jgi:hypothetical protein